jgi:antitoxin component HigA of HigAB toxin-antitoxin module
MTALASRYASVFRSVETAADHRRAKVAISELMDARPGTAESFLLRALATLVDAYERRLRPEPKTLDPVAVVEFYMEQGGRSQTEYPTARHARISAGASLAALSTKPEPRLWS